MKKIIAIALVASVVAPAFAQTRVGVSVGINQPGVYGRIDIGELPAPALVYSQPVLIAPPPVAVPRRPIYLYVPPTHQSDWRRYCGRYDACGQPVYFVQDRWVRERYEAQQPDWDSGKHRGQAKHSDASEHHHGNGHGDDHRN